MARFELWPATSSALASASAHCTANKTSVASRGLRVSVMRESLHRARLARRTNGRLWRNRKCRHDLACEPAQLLLAARHRQQHIFGAGTLQRRKLHGNVI